jgi:hypothetical protein
VRRAGTQRVQIRRAYRCCLLYRTCSASPISLRMTTALSSRSRPARHILSIAEAARGVVAQAVARKDPLASRAAAVLPISEVAVSLYQPLVLPLGAAPGPEARSAA